MFDKLTQYTAMKYIQDTDSGVTRTEILRHCGNNLSKKDLDQVLSKMAEIGVLEAEGCGMVFDVGAGEVSVNVRGMRYRLKKTEI